MAPASAHRVHLSSFAKVISGFAFKSKEFQQTGIPVIKIKNIRLGFVDRSETQCVSEKYQSIDSKYHVHGGDILISLTGSHINQPNSVVGRVARYPGDQEPALLNQRAGKVIINAPEQCDTPFLYYHLLDEQVRREIAAFAHGAANQANVSPGQIESLEFNLPPIPTQHKIASILSAYDDLIENNLRRIKILEEMAQALYREWFVKFRFPGHEKVRMVDSPLGKIPEGWGVAPLSEMCHLVMGQSPKSEFYNTDGAGLPFHQGVTDFGDRFPTDRLHCTVDNRIAERGDVLFSVRAPVGRINVSNKRIVIGRGLSAIRHRANYQWFAFHLLKEKFKEEDTMGGGTIFKAVTKKDMQGIEFIVPNDVIVARFEELVLPMEGEIENLTKKNATLRQTRDLLLPRLISGELDVSDLEINIPEEAA